VDEELLAAQGERALRFIPVADFPLLKDYVGRGVITTATYAARQFGVGSAMGMMKAAKLCPQAIVLPVDFDEIRKYSRLFKSTIAEIAPLMQDRGIDEVYIDFTDVPGRRPRAGAADPEKHFRQDRPDLLGRCGAQQAAGQDGQRVQQAQWHFDCS
jgi:DNA polymerase-4